MSARPRLSLICLVLASVIFPSAPLPAEWQPGGLLLTWREDPLTTMVIDWQTLPEDSARTHLDFRRRGSENWQQAEASSFPFPFSKRTVHRVELTNLEAGTEYEFRVGTDGRIYWFRTMPTTLERPLRLAVGGDTLHRQEWMERTNRQILAYEPDLAVMGGDLAYADGRPERVERWYQWFEAVHNTLITEEGRIIPIVVAIGNHEVVGGYYWGADRGRDNYLDDDSFRQSIAPYFYTLFAFPGHPGYGVLDFGEYLSLIILDTDHSGPVEGRQTLWLEEVLSKRSHIPHVLPIYHVPAWPSVRSFDGAVSTRIREHWVPLFEKYGVRLAFENHDHAYKRTHPIRAGRIHPNGIVYVGDGSWGVGIREVHPAEETWYLKHSLSARQFTLLTLEDTGRHLLMVDEFGEVIDEFPSTPKPPRR